MAAGVDIEIWLQSHRLNETRRQIAALRDVLMLLVEMADVAAADAMAARLDRLQKDLEYQNHVMVAMQARAEVRHAARSAADAVAAPSISDRAAPPA